jgi:hypothetical protein
MGRGIRDAGTAIWGTIRKKRDMKNLAPRIADRVSRIKPATRHFFTGVNRGDRGFSLRDLLLDFRAHLFSNEKMVFQSFFILMIVQPFFFAWSYNAWVKVPTLVLGSPCAGP